MHPEVPTTPHLTNIDQLQEGRFNAARLKSESQMRAAFGMDRTIEPDVAITRLDSMRSDCLYLGAADIMSLEAIGVNLPDLHANIVEPTILSDQEVATVDLGDEHLIMNKLGEGLSFKFSKNSDVQNHSSIIEPTLLKDKIKARFADSPAHQAIAKMKLQVASLDKLPEVVSTEKFDPSEDPLGTYAFLNDIDLLRPNRDDVHTMIANKKSLSELITNRLAELPSYQATRTEDSSATKFSWGKGVVKELSIDKETGAYSFSVRQDPAANYTETANQSPSSEAVPFVETECAKQLGDLLDSAGLMFHPSFQLEMMKVGESDRYGSVYTQLSREVAKWINDPKRTRLSSIVVPVEDEFYGSQLIDKAGYGQSPKDQQYRSKIAEREDDGYNNETEARTRWAAASRNFTSESAETLVTMIDAALARSGEVQSDLPVTQQEVKLRDGACFDVLAYYVGAATEPFSGKGLKSNSENGVPMLEKTLGSHTFLTTKETVFNGVSLPKGALFSKADDGWAFLRLTAFSFDKEEDQIASAGSELAKVYKNESRTVSAIGGATLAHLVSASN